LHLLFAEGKEESAESDAIRDQMESPWYAMTLCEQKRIRGLSADLYALAENADPRVPMNSTECDAWERGVRVRLADLKHGDADAMLAFLRQPLPEPFPLHVVREWQAQCWDALGDPETAALFRHAAQTPHRNGVPGAATSAEVAV
jgi:hypothetical protein